MKDLQEYISKQFSNQQRDTMKGDGNMMVVTVGSVTFFKAIVIKTDIFGSEIIDERHFKTVEEAEQYKRDVIADTGLLCVVCQM